jgi:hypothetical protein
MAIFPVHIFELDSLSALADSKFQANLNCVPFWRCCVFRG